MPARCFTAEPVGAPGNQGTSEMVKNTVGAITYNEWSFAIDHGLATADIRTSAGIVHIGSDWVGKTLAPVTIKGEGQRHRSGYFTGF